MSYPSLVIVPRTMLAATGFLTRLPVRPQGGLAGAAAFALVGAGIGLVASLPVLVVGAAAPLLGAALAVGLIAVASGGLHLDGVADTIDALAAPNSERAEEARRDPAVGALGAAGVSLVLLAEASSIAGLSPAVVVPALIVAGAASRSVPVLGARLVRHRNVGLGGWWRDAVRFIDVVVCLASLGLIVAASRSIVHAAAAGVGLAAGVVILLLLKRRFGAVTGDSHGAAVEGAFLVALIVEVTA
jgi:adenosylcobinamide-GDP ribazoletransferase